MARISILGVEFDNISPDKALNAALEMMDGKPGYVVTPNPEFVHACIKNPELKQLLNNAALCVPDGIGIIYAGRILGTPFASRVPGIELGEALAASMAKTGKRLYLLGAKPGVAEKAAEKLCEKYKGLMIAGTHDGYFKDDETVAAEIAASKADAVFVCMGFPRQERFMSEQLARSGAGVMLGLGGSLDIFAGTLRRAPKFFIKTNLEWLYRLLKEPSRIRRMMKLPAFLMLVIRERFKGKR